MSKSAPRSHPAFDEFVATIATLRSPNGCPWDREQTHESIASNMVEEAYEAVDAIEQSDVAHLREELGDVLLQVVLQSQIAADAGEFTIDDVCADVNAKMIRRHPHVFGDAKAGNANEVLDVWDKIKLQEKASSKSDEHTRILDGVPSSFLALTLAQKMSRKAAAAGFEWETLDDIWDKVEEEIAELKGAYASALKDDAGKLIKSTDAARDLPKSVTEGSSKDMPEGSPQTATYQDVELEFGDVLFSLVNVGRRMGINSENALRATCRKFRSRFEAMEDAAVSCGRKIQDLDIDEMEKLWQAAKGVDATR